MDTLTNLWAAASNHPMPVISDTGMAVLIQVSANNGWFVGKPLMAQGDYYIADSTSVMFAGDQAIWTTL